MKITELREYRNSFTMELQPDGTSLRVDNLVEAPRNIEVITGWRRFGHYVIDVIFMYAFAFVLGIIMALTNTNTSFLHDPVFSRIFTVLTSFVYYFCLESLFHTSLGKLITGSVVIDEYGNNPSVAAIAKRSLIRIIPLEALSCFSDRGWHDKWSNTYVVSRTERNTLRKLLKSQEGFSGDEDLLD